MLGILGDYQATVLFPAPLCCPLPASKARINGFATLTRRGNETMDTTGLDVNGALHQHVLLEAQLQATLNILPAHAWYALPNGELTFLNERAADYLGLPIDHPLRLGTGSGPDDREETRRARSDRLNTGGAGEVSFRVGNAEGAYRWFISCAAPVRAANGALSGAALRLPRLSIAR